MYKIVEISIIFMKKVLIEFELWLFNKLFLLDTAVKYCGSIGVTVWEV